VQKAISINFLFYPRTGRPGGGRAAAALGMALPKHWNGCSDSLTAAARPRRTDRDGGEAPASPTAAVAAWKRQYGHGGGSATPSARLPRRRRRGSCGSTVAAPAWHHRRRRDGNDVATVAVGARQRGRR